MTSPACISMLLPAFKSHALANSGIIISQVVSLMPFVMLQHDTCSRQLNIPQLALYALVPLTTEHLEQGLEIAVRPKDAPLITMPQLELMISEKQRNDNLLQKTNEALMTYTAELKRLKK